MYYIARQLTQGTSVHCVNAILLSVLFLQEDSRPGKELVTSLIDTKQAIDTKMATSQLALFKV